jgi:hypothetical protein
MKVIGSLILGVAHIAVALAATVPSHAAKAVLLVLNTKAN